MTNKKDQNTFYRFKYIAVISFLASINHVWIHDNDFIYALLTFVCLPIILFADIVKNIHITNLWRKNKL